MVKRSRLRKNAGKKRVTRLKRKKPNWIITTDAYGNRELMLNVDITRDGKKLNTLRVLEDASAKEVEARLYKKGKLLKGLSELVSGIYRVHNFDTVKETKEFTNKVQNSYNPIETLDI